MSDLFLIKEGIEFKLHNTLFNILFIIDVETKHYLLF